MKVCWVSVCGTNIILMMVLSDIWLWAGNLAFKYCVQKTNWKKQQQKTPTTNSTKDYNSWETKDDWTRNKNWKVIKRQYKYKMRCVLPLINSSNCEKTYIFFFLLRHRFTVHLVFLLKLYGVHWMGEQGSRSLRDHSVQILLYGRNKATRLPTAIIHIKRREFL